ncbi:dTMP kinase [Paenibacillus algorifonticola]|uniref:dTMP kinase n=1 Tax=Paenibacillus algorifonticola TaxID=684063 RepID=UPI003D2B7B1A
MKIHLKKHNYPGLLIVSCGIDGAGKSSALETFVDSIISEGHKETDIVRLRQPSDWWRTDRHVRSTFHKQGDGEIFDDFALGVFGAADRLNQQALLIEPALRAGKTVVIDRYVFCLFAYYIAKNDENILYLTRLCELLFWPDITFILDCPPEIAINRVSKRDGANDEMADQQIGPTTKFRDAYTALAQNNNLNIISSIENIERVSQEMMRIYKRMLQLK